MRMRLKKWARPELESCPFYVGEPDALRGKWRQSFANPALPLHVELGCGKGVSTSQMALHEPDVNFVAIDINYSVLGVAKRNVESAFSGIRPVDNIKLAIHEIELIDRMFDENDRVERVYISFPNPWTQRRRQSKHRLTHTKLLTLYRAFMAENAEVFFKTDDDELFKDSLRYFPDAGFDIKFITYDLAREQGITNYVSEHEKMFMDEGKQIKALIAVKI